MNNYSYKSIVSNTEAEALKEMIFKRARERAESITQETQASYTSAVHAEVMDLARNSFVSNKNPFAMGVEPKKIETEEPVQENVKKNEQIGFSTRKVPEIKQHIINNGNITTDNIAKAEVNATMAEARDGLYKKQNFVGALEFLNSQATISLIKTHGQKFEAVV